MDGFIILDKPANMTSRRAGATLARMFGAKTFGHIGTLDPMASGLLPVALGRATRMIPFVEQAGGPVKEYLFSMRFGAWTDTLDITGRETARDDFVPDAQKVLDAAATLHGRIAQTPPAYSAVHIDGRRAYDIARRGAAVDIPPRMIEIFELTPCAVGGRDWDFSVRCARGTYVRAIARDIAEKCGAMATVTMIRRIDTVGVGIKNAVKLDFLENLFNNGGDIGQYLMPADFGLGDIPVLNLSDKDAHLYRCGGFIKAGGAGLRRVYDGNGFIGIGYVADGVLRPKKTIF